MVCRAVSTFTGTVEERQSVHGVHSMIATDEASLSRYLGFTSSTVERSPVSTGNPWPGRVRRQGHPMFPSRAVPCTAWPKTANHRRRRTAKRHLGLWFVLGKNKAGVCHMFDRNQPSKGLEKLWIVLTQVHKASNMYLGFELEKCWCCRGTSRWTSAGRLKCA